MAEAKKKTTKKTVKPIVDETVDTSTEVVAEVKKETKLAKAGKRSAKAIKEAEAKQEKESRKVSGEKSEEKPAVKQAPARTRLERAGKKYRQLASEVDKSKVYELKDALTLAVKTSPTKFDATVELHVNLNVDPKQADQNVRDTLTLPEGTGKSLRVAVFAESTDHKAAKDAGADIVGEDDFLAQLDKGVIDFDVLITSPKLMAKLGKYAKVLGPKGLMPNPKSGTITTDIAKAVKSSKGGKVEFRVDQAGIIHLGVGKVSFGPEKLLNNVEAVTKAIKAAKPASVKAIYVKSAFIATTMGPSIKVSI